MKLTQRDVEHIVADVLGHSETAFVAKQFKISQRRVQQLPVLQKPGRLKCGATQVGKYLRNKLGIKIGNNKIQEILREANMEIQSMHLRSTAKSEGIDGNLRRGWSNNC